VTSPSPRRLGREAKSEVVLTARLRSVLARLNPDLPSQAFDQAIEELVRDRSAMAPAQANREIYQLLENGVHKIGGHNIKRRFT
jgi:type I restriction enzyme R subunit